MLGQVSAPAARRNQLDSAAQLWLTLAVGGVVFLILVGAVFHRHALRMRELREKREKRGSPSGVDAWAEAGRRMPTPPVEDGGPAKDPG